MCLWLEAPRIPVMSRPFTLARRLGTPWPRSRPPWNPARCLKRRRQRRPPQLSPGRRYLHYQNGPRPTDEARPPPPTPCRKHRAECSICAPSSLSTRSRGDRAWGSSGTQNLAGVFEDWGRRALSVRGARLSSDEVFPEDEDEDSRVEESVLSGASLCAPACPQHTAGSKVGAVSLGPVLVQVASISTCWAFCRVR